MATSRIASRDHETLAPTRTLRQSPADLTHDSPRRLGEQCATPREQQPDAAGVRAIARHEQGSSIARVTARSLAQWKRIQGSRAVSARRSLSETILHARPAVVLDRARRLTTQGPPDAGKTGTDSVSFVAPTAARRRPSRHFRAGTAPRAHEAPAPRPSVACRFSRAPGARTRWRRRKSRGLARPPSLDTSGGEDRTEMG
jgi:hypothetical protein